MDDFKEINKAVRPQGFVFENETCDLCGKYAIVAMSESPTIMGSIDARDGGSTYLRVCATCIEARKLAFALLNPATQGATTDGNEKPR